MSLKHSTVSETLPGRVVILGAGFVGGAITARLAVRGVAAQALRSADLDLLAADAGARLSTLLTPETSLVFTSAKAPVKSEEMLIDNLRMLPPLRDVMAAQPVAHLLYVSSDAVYADSDVPMTESSPTAPTSLHGAMHLARELALAQMAGETPFAILRPTLIYGDGDPHNGYGPNRFRRLAQAGEPITLFGEGEERRDHIDVKDVAEIAARIVMHRSAGVLNAVTGAVRSFREIAEATSANVRGTSRNGPMPHNGYRAFDASAVSTAFPDVQLASVLDWARDG